MAEKRGWESAEAARRYLEAVNVSSPKRQEILSLISDLAAAFLPEQPRILDLGAGAGDLTNEILEYRPGAHAWLLDLSEEMVRVSRERFEGNPHIHVLRHDLDEGLPAQVKTQDFDAVVSCFSIHHVRPERRLPLYAGVHRILKPGGLFINGDRFRAESPEIAEWERDNFTKARLSAYQQYSGQQITFEQAKKEQIECEKQMGDRPGTVWQMEADLRQAGFVYVDCIWKYHIMGIVVAVK